MLSPSGNNAQLLHRAQDMPQLRSCSATFRWGYGRLLYSPSGRGEAVKLALVGAAAVV